VLVVPIYGIVSFVHEVKKGETKNLIFCKIKLPHSNYRRSGMLIVPIGKLCLQVGEIEKPEDVQKFVEGLDEAIKEVVKRSVDTALDVEVDRSEEHTSELQSL
jgi:hypothetical protein